MADGNKGDKRSWQNGGVVSIAGDELSNIVMGTLEWETPGAAEMPQMDRGIIGDSLAGGDRPSTGKLTLHLARMLTGGTPSSTGAAALAGVITSNKYLNWDVATGKLIQKALVIKIPNYRGASAGESITFAKAIFPDGIKYKAGQDSGENFDTVEIAFKDLAPSPTIATY